MIYQRITLSTAEPVGAPGPLPASIAGWSVADAADLTGLDAAYDLADTGYWPVIEQIPTYNPVTHDLVAGDIVIDAVAKSVTRTWTAVINSERLQASIVAATQARLDTFAKTRGYDGILSATTYAASTIPQFSAEGQYAVVARDLTWAALYAMLAEVQAGTRPAPDGFADIEPDLPALGWPG